MTEKREFNQEKEIDLLHLLNVVIKNIAIIIIVAVAAAIIGLVYAKFIVTPSYQSSAMMYVNNKSDSSSGYLSSGEITAAKSLVSTYSVIMKTNSTLEKVIDYTGVDYTPAQLKKMISAVSVDNTEIFKITVTSPNPEDSKLIAEGIIHVLPDSIAAVVSGARVATVDNPTDGVKSAPPASKSVLIGASIGFFLMAALVIVFDLIDDKIHDEKYITENYSIPVLAVIPNIYMKSQGGAYHDKV
ncbi:MAG: Wzz/FepE/Etk N-terminal domain-containing protein [Clostridia bacterium]|nr:Wzz/FepE/Etk N-terminal domain-containing protein [Clostridia bacterium]